jgi:hypothetical protein
MKKLFPLLLLFLTLGTQAEASIFTVIGDTGDGPVSASVQFTLGNGKVEIIVTNLLANPKSDGQLVSGIDFTISGATGAGSLKDASGLISFIGSSKTGGGRYTAGVLQDLTVSSPSGNGSSVWGLVAAGELTTLTARKPEYLIIGPDDHGGFDPTAGLYSNSNSSIYQHDPVVLGSATFDLAIPGITADSTISGVQVEFGTSGVTLGFSEVVLDPHSVPEPSSFALGSLGAVGLILYYRRRRAH